MARLTKREQEIARLLARGRRPAQIARALVVSRHTVYMHVRHMREKTGDGSTFELALRMRDELRDVVE